MQAVLVATAALEEAPARGFLWGVWPVCISRRKISELRSRPILVSRPPKSQINVTSKSSADRISLVGFMSSGRAARAADEFEGFSNEAAECQRLSDRSLTGRTTPALPGAQAIHLNAQRKNGLLR